MEKEIEKYFKISNQDVSPAGAGLFLCSICTRRGAWEHSSYPAALSGSAQGPAQRIGPARPPAPRGRATPGPGDTGSGETPDGEVADKVQRGRNGGDFVPLNCGLGLGSRGMSA